MTNYLLTNDDGIDAPGLVAMERALCLALKGQKFAYLAAAPDRGYSGCGHVTTNHEPLRVEALTDRRFKVVGTPADCARLGIVELAPDTQVVLSGINAGANAGVDIWTSGTVAAAREAGWLGVPAIAISQYMNGTHARNWEHTAEMAAKALRMLLSKPLKNAYWNINLPDADIPNAELAIEQLEIKRTFVEPQHLPVVYQKQADGAFQFAGDYQSRPRTPGSDVDACFSGAISICEVPWPGIP